MKNTNITIAAVLAAAIVSLPVNVESHSLLTMTKGTTPAYAITTKTTTEKVIQGALFPWTGKNEAAADGKVEYIDASEAFWVAAGYTVLGMWLGGKLARANVEQGREPFLGFIG